MDYDVICIGGGGAGTMAAVTAAARGARVAILSKEPLGYGNTRVAGGRQAFPGLVPADDEDAFVADLMAGGEYLNHPTIARLVAREARDGAHLLEDMGHVFTRDETGQLSVAVASQRGGHRLPRSIASPGEGNAIGQALRAALARGNVDVWEDAVACRLIADERGVHGVVVLRLSDGEVVPLLSKAVVIATGGAGWLYYPHTDCVPSTAGDGYALAFEAGAELADMEFVQFIPFAITHPPSMVGLPLGEPADAGPEGVLLNGRGKELLRHIARHTRAEVSEVMAGELAAGNVTAYGGLLLDLTPNLRTAEGRAAYEVRKDKFQLMLAKAAYGPKAARWEEPWDICPTAHFNMGGIRIDEDGHTAVPGLFAAGEAQAGTHGANRLGSVALAEIFVFGRRAGIAASHYAAEAPVPQVSPAILSTVAAEVSALFGRRGKHRPIDLIRRLQSTMWRNVGLLRNEAALVAALAEFTTLERDASDIQTSPGHVYNTEVADAAQLRLMLGAARAITTAALVRRESRGAHLRSDFPDRDDASWRRNVVLSCRDGRIQWRLSPPGGD